MSSRPISADVARQLDRRVRDLGISSWEIISSSNADAPATLALSPGGNSDLQDLCAHVVALAPSIDGWRFQTSKPRKRWNYRFRWPGAPAEIDARSWRFRVLAYPDGMYEIILVGGTSPQLSTEKQQRALIFVIESELGEALAQRKICRMAVEPADSLAEFNDTVGVSDLYPIVSGEPPDVDRSKLY